MTDTSTVEPEVSIQHPAPVTEEGDHDRFAHYVIGGTEAIVRAMVYGEPCTALCGKVWVPSADPERFPVCPECKEIKETMGFGEGGDAQ